jgi:threonine/homoserine/homoserine lactone efflux protein
MSQLLGLAGFALVGSITPGPNNSLLLASGSRFGFRRTAPHVAGTAIGMGALVFAVAGGVGVVLLAVPGIDLALKVVGSAYLLYLAARILGSRGAGATVAARPLGLLGGVGFQFANPKGWLFALAAAGTFLPPGLMPLAGAVAVAAPCTASPTTGAPSGSSTSPWRWSWPRRWPSSGSSHGLRAGSPGHARPSRAGRGRPGKSAGCYWPWRLTERARRALWLAALFLWMTPLLAARS